MQGCDGRESGTSPAEVEERMRLEAVKARLRHTLRGIDVRLDEVASDVQDQKAHLWENRADLDHVEKIAARESIRIAATSGEAVQAQRRRLLRLLRSPYFGRIDFARAGDRVAEPIYIGIHHFSDTEAGTNLIHDWRAPISTLFYDHETGPARYSAPAGEIAGEVLLKRQFRIRDGLMEFMLESGLNITDEVLQRDLARASDEGMKTIVATIQRDQNAIVRNEHAQVLIIQGVAGSGKTSIALHRIAFLLYRFKETLTSKDILIISPNRVFGDYIANVLPELGEEAVTEIGMEDLADEILGRAYRFQTFFEQTALLLEGSDESMQQRIAFKASPDFLRLLGDYADHVDRTVFTAQDVWLGRRLVPAWFFDESFRKHRGVPDAERLDRVFRAVEANVGIHYHHDLAPEERRQLRAALKSMLKRRSLRETYIGLFAWIGRPELFVPAKGGRLEYADVFPLVYLQLRLFGPSTAYAGVKHLLIDEMQDYTPVQYAVIARLFKCKMTILGDASQAVNPYTSSTSADIERVFFGATCVKLTRSYRSSYEITRFAQAICPDPQLQPVERHGEPPQIHACRTRAEQARLVGALIDAFAGSGHHSLGIVCKTQRQAEKLHGALRAKGYTAHLLGTRSSTFAQGLIVCSAHMAKGLEFDQVIVPDADSTNYATSMDRNMLYVACTRAMHKLVLSFTGELTRFIPASAPGATRPGGGATTQRDAHQEQGSEPPART